MMRALVFLLLVGAGCELRAPNPANKDCVEFDYPTTHGNRQINCRLIWCQGTVDGSIKAGMSTLWCDDIAPVTCPQPSGAWR